MADDILESSDRLRSARPLQHAQIFRLPEPLPLELGGELPEVSLTYETYGELSAAKDNAILICHALSGDSHVARHDEDDDPGWWEVLVGPGKHIDTNRYFAICANILGGCRGSTGPDSRNPTTGERYGADFPPITVGDMVEAQLQLIDHLGIEKLRSVVGGSLGGHQVLAWAALHPERIESVIPIATSVHLTSQAIAFDVVGRNSILRDPHFAGGQYYDAGRGPDVGLAVARMLGHITYLSQEAMTEKFKPGATGAVEFASAFERKFSVGSYLAYQGERFVERFDANSYMTLSMAMDLFELGADKKEIQRSFERADCRWLILSFSSDWLFPPFQSRGVVEALIPLGRRVSYCEVETRCGHDAFLLEDDVHVYGELIRAFLEPDQGYQPEEPGIDSVSLIRSERLDYDQIIDLIEPGASVLDLGCGSGELLHRLRARGHTTLMGAELSVPAILSCTRRGLPVIHTDIDRGLGIFADGQFDTVVLSQTLQAVGDVERVLREMLRVGRRVIVSFPNAAHERNRRRLDEEGRAPHSSVLHAHHWYDAPPLRLISILDFEELCDRQSLHIERRLALDTRGRRQVERDPNRNADLAIFVLEQ
jgi:homoserine O-acetyltransferase